MGIRTEGLFADLRLLALATVAAGLALWLAISVVRGATAPVAPRTAPTVDAPTTAPLVPQTTSAPSATAAPANSSAPATLAPLATPPATGPQTPRDPTQVDPYPPRNFPDEPKDPPITNKDPIYIGEGR